MKEEQQIETRLWNYIDGSAGVEEKKEIEALLQNDKIWQDCYRELTDMQQLLNNDLELEEPSMRFIKNVMEEISKTKVAPATKMYINKKIISVIAAFFIISILVLLFYGLAGINWSMTSSNPISIDLKQFDVSRYLNNESLNFFLMLNTVLGLILFDRFLRRNRTIKHRQQNV